MGCSLRRRAPNIAACLAIALLAAPLERLRGQESDDPDQLFWGYAPMFGTGVYRQSGGDGVAILRVSPSIEIRDAAAVRRGANFGVRLLLSFSAGVDHAVGEGLPPDFSEDLEHAAFLPGVELEFPAERFALRVRAEFGWGTELSGEEPSAWLSSFGVRSRLTWPDAAGRPALISGLLWAGYNPEGGEPRSLARLSQGLEFDVGVPRWQFRGETMHLMPHVLAEWFFEPPEWFELGYEGSRHDEMDWQIGLAARRELGFEILGFEFDAVGLAYRFSDRGDGVRLYLNSIF